MPSEDADDEQQPQRPQQRLRQQEGEQLQLQEQPMQQGEEGLQLQRIRTGRVDVLVLHPSSSRSESLALGSRGDVGNRPSNVATSPQNDEPETGREESKENMVANRAPISTRSSGFRIERRRARVYVPIRSRVQSAPASVEQGLVPESSRPASRMTDAIFVPRPYSSASMFANGRPHLMRLPGVVYPDDVAPVAATASTESVVERPNLLTMPQLPSRPTTAPERGRQRPISSRLHQVLYGRQSVQQPADLVHRLLHARLYRSLLHRGEQGLPTSSSQSMLPSSTSIDLPSSTSGEMYLQSPASSLGPSYSAAGIVTAMTPSSEEATMPQMPPFSSLALASPAEMSTASSPMPKSSSRPSSSGSKRSMSSQSQSAPPEAPRAKRRHFDDSRVPQTLFEFEKKGRPKSLPPSYRTPFDFHSKGEPGYRSMRDDPATEDVFHAMRGWSSPQKGFELSPQNLVWIREGGLVFKRITLRGRVSELCKTSPAATFFFVTVAGQKVLVMTVSHHLLPKLDNDDEVLVEGAAAYFDDQISGGTRHGRLKAVRVDLLDSTLRVYRTGRQPDDTDMDTNDIPPRANRRGNPDVPRRPDPHGKPSRPERPERPAPPGDRSDRSQGTRVKGTTLQGIGVDALRKRHAPASGGNATKRALVGFDGARDDDVDCLKVGGLPFCLIEELKGCKTEKKVCVKAMIIDVSNEIIYDGCQHEDCRQKLVCSGSQKCSSCNLDTNPKAYFYPLVTLVDVSGKMGVSMGHKVTSDLLGVVDDVHGPRRDGNVFERMRKVFFVPRVFVLTSARRAVDGPFEWEVTGMADVAHNDYARVLAAIRDRTIRKQPAAELQLSFSLSSPPKAQKRLRAH